MVSTCLHARPCCNVVMLDLLPLSLPASSQLMFHGSEGISQLHEHRSRTQLRMSESVTSEAAAKLRCLSVSHLRLALYSAMPCKAHMRCFWRNELALSRSCSGRSSPIREERHHAVQGIDVGASGQDRSVELVQLQVYFGHPAPAPGIYDGCCNNRQDDGACPNDNRIAQESHGCCTGRSSACAGLLMRPVQASGSLSEE